MTACATPPSIPHPGREPSAAGPAGGGGCCTGGGPPHGRAPAALPPPASGSRAARPPRRGPAPQPSPSRPPTRSCPRRRRRVGADSTGSPRSGRRMRCQTATSGSSPQWRRSASAARGRTAPPGQRRCGWGKRATRSSCGRSPADVHLILGRTRPATAVRTRVRPPLRRPDPTAPARTRTSSLRAIRGRHQGSATGSRAGVRL
jgi:hypothetical protein